MLLINFASFLGGAAPDIGLINVAASSAGISLHKCAATSSENRQVFRFLTYFTHDQDYFFAIFS